MTAERARAEAQLHDQISRLWNRHVTAAALSEADDRPDNLTSLILRALGRSGPVRAGDAAVDLGISRASISRRLSWLEAQGFVQAEADPLDGRASLISLTATGRRRLEELDLAGIEGLREIAAEFTENEIEAFVSLLARFNDRANARRARLEQKRVHDLR